MLSVSQTPFLNNNPFPGINELKEEMANFLISFDNFVKGSKKRIDQDREKFKTALRSDKENLEKLKGQCAHFEKKKEEMHQQLEKEEKEFKQAEDSLQALIKRGQILEELVAGHQSKVLELRENFKRITEFITQRERRKMQKYQKALPILDLFEKGLGLYIESLDSGFLRFRYTMIDPKNKDRDFWFIVDTSTGIVTEIFPKVMLSERQIVFDTTLVPLLRSEFVNLVRSESK
ncbi:hypothetical protein ROZALSC1DRAFT_30945 [Rozella allomycis CSF55]|uniref:Kinetochore protein SPC25 n=1 Tax=Rozella allomycis (strain CSF55) TaxID=988480 RepID=A0A075AZJ0_ROZAC|nr:hypothetical protein O9G_004600 [Rozella allomycis CSF55]RKP17223.1 hypothetical protein ROZALSC1DRAFT_30945 [Rozella allomycis CSF55]|eukprot:EPZ34004.1 hypothetical protein O9G_004600 [Rozella allomycis CSF55]